MIEIVNRVPRPTYRISPDGLGKSKAVDEEGGILARLWNVGNNSWRVAFTPAFESDGTLYPTYIVAEAAVRHEIESWD